MATRGIIDSGGIPAAIGSNEGSSGGMLGMYKRQATIGMLIGITFLLQL
jgi:hypothetical protein